MTFGDTFAQLSVKGALTRAGVAWLLFTPAIAAARIWWSSAAAVTVFVIGVAAYVALAMRYVRRHNTQGLPE